MDTSPASRYPENLPRLEEEVIQARMLRELFARTRESALVGFLPVFLIVWSHWTAQPREQLLLWAGCAVLVLAFRVLLAHLFLVAPPQTQIGRGRLWFSLEWLGSIGLAGVWVGSITMVGTGQVDVLFFLRLIFIVALVAFVLSALGIEMRLYASFMTAIVAGTLWQLHRHYPVFVQELPVVNWAFVVYAIMLLVRSRGEHRRTREWVRARLTQRKLLDQLHQNIQKELHMHELLRNRTQELEASNRKLGELAIRDGLTGAFRRGHIEEELRRQVKAWERRPEDFSILLLDIDNFKRVNDDHGHPAGDEVLRRLVAQLPETLRGSDLYGRWGGEEFMVLLPGAALVQAVETAERLRLAIAALTFKDEADRRFCITVSIGVAHLEPGATADTLTERADKALYAAKHAGRNRVVAYEPGQTQFAPL
ncbi:MAG: GGDEF domain-containing protein [Hylemonella sp.]|nr:GGDEF domain-containing protein [Hylemonella sp.]